MGSTLSGKLEELGLDDILQLITVSRRTGILTLKSRGREAVLQLRDGLVVRAASTGFQQSLGELLVQKGSIGADQVREALAFQQHEGFRQRIGSILHHRYQLDLQVIEQTVREQMANVVLTLFAWHEGSYDFEPCAEVETVDAAYLDPQQLMQEQGGSSERLSAEGQRFEHELGVPDAVQPSVAAPAAVVSDTKRCALVVVDDDSATAQAIADQFPAEQLAVFPFTNSEQALIAIDTLCRDGRRPMVLIDLIMPKMDGSGVLGGLEILKMLRQNFHDLVVILMTDFRHADAEAEAAEIGCTCLLKPRRGNIESEEFAGFISQLRTELQTCRAAVAARPER
jgi:CheY-like chemotaxis protein